MGREHLGRFSITDSSMSTEIGDPEDPTRMSSILDLIAFADNRIFLSAKDVLYDSCGKVQKPRQLTYSEMRQFLEIAITQAPDTELLRILASEIRDQLLFRLAETPEDSTEIDPLLEYIDSQFL